MHTENFYTVKTNGQEMIRDHKTFLQINVNHLDNGSFMPYNAHEITLYGIGQDCLLGFETVNIRNYDLQLVAYALAWYVDYIDKPDMTIRREDPRMEFRLKRA
jgi:hypothetical protein